jgi:hypothetical protein
MIRRLPALPIALVALLFIRAAAAQPLQERSLSHPVTALSGGYVAVSDTLVENVSVEIENRGDTTLTGFRLVAGQRNWHTVSKMLEGVLTPDMSEEQRARALWQFVRDHRYHWWPVSDFAGESSDPVRFFNSYGYGFCADAADALGTLLRRAGFPVRFWNPGSPPGHVVIEAFFDDAWHVLDADQDGLYLRDDGRTIASVNDLILDPGLAARAGGIHADLLAGLYAGTALDGWYAEAGPLDTDPGEGLSYTLKPRQRLVLNWAGVGLFRNDTEFPPEEPPVYGNAVLDWRLSFHDPVARAQLIDQSNVDWQNGVSPATPSQPADVVLRVGTPHPTVGLRARLDIQEALGEGDVEVFVASAVDEIHVSSSEFASGTHRHHPAFVHESNVATLYEDELFPVVHAMNPVHASSVTWRAQRAGAGPLTIEGLPYRATPFGDVALLLSLDGDTWVEVWRAGPWDLGYLPAHVDVSWVPPGASFYVRAWFHAAVYSEGAGFAWLSIRGVDPLYGSASWRSPAGLGTTAVDLDLSAALPRRGRAVYDYVLKLRVNSTATTVTRLDHSAVLQVAPRALPGLSTGETRFDYVHDSDEVVDVEIRHTWREHPSSPPAAPLAVPAAFAVGESVVLSWTVAQSSSALPVSRFYVQVCSDATCTSTLASAFDGWVSGGTTSWLAGDPAVLEPGRLYYWRVRAEDSLGRLGPFSAPAVFAAVPASDPGVRVDVLDGPAAAVTQPFVKMRGRGESTYPLARVSWATSSGASGTAEGLDVWAIEAIPVSAGSNVVTITVEDVLGRRVVHQVQLDVPYFSYVLAEGVTGSFFRTDVAVANPNIEAAVVQWRMSTEEGVVAVRDAVLAPLSRAVLVLNDVPELDDRAVAVEVRSLDALPLAVERTTTWDTTRYGAHASSAVSSPSTRWFFAEGSQGFFDTFLLIVNPGADPAEVDVDFLLETGGPISLRLDVAPGARRTVYVGHIAGMDGRSFSIDVRSSVPVVAERAMYFSTWRMWEGGHASAGVPTASTRWLFAEGVTGDFDSYLLVGNPEYAPANVEVEFLKPDGDVVRKSFSVAGRSRRTVHVNVLDEALRWTSFSATVTSDVPIVAERASYWSWPGLGWHEGHATRGLQSAGVVWALADARADQATKAETYVLVANLDSTRTATLELSWFDDAGVVSQQFVHVTPTSRATVHVPMSASSQGGFGLLVESIGEVPIIVERATYWGGIQNGWPAGAAVNATRIR